MPFHMLVIYTYYLCVFHNYTERYGYYFPIYVKEMKI